MVRMAEQSHADHFLPLAPTLTATTESGAAPEAVGLAHVLVRATAVLVCPGQRGPLGSTWRLPISQAPGSISVQSSTSVLHPMGLRGSPTSQMRVAS